MYKPKLIALVFLWILVRLPEPADFFDQRSWVLGLSYFTRSYITIWLKKQKTSKIPNWITIRKTYDFNIYKYYFIFFILDRQPNGGLAENCLTTFMPDDDDSPRLYDRPCVEVDSIGETGHKFFCECNVPDQKQNHKGNKKLFL